jgi:predicted transcriptional regulator
MTITAYLQKMNQATDNSSLLEAMQDTTDIWSNNACKGYAISAAIAAGLDKQQTGRLIDALEAAFDEMTVDEAERLYQDGDY